VEGDAVGFDLAVLNVCHGFRSETWRGF
jgi:hypothetical protein